MNSHFCPFVVTLIKEYDSYSYFLKEEKKAYKNVAALVQVGSGNCETLTDQPSLPSLCPLRYFFRNL